MGMDDLLSGGVGFPTSFAGEAQVVSPADTDEFLVDTGSGALQYETLAQIRTQADKGVSGGRRIAGSPTVTDPLNLGNASITGLRVITAASGVDYLTANSSTAGNPVVLGAGGTDTDIGINITPKGAGAVTVGGSAFVVPVGTAAAPGVAFAGDTDSGLAHIVTDTSSLIAGGVEAARATAVASAVNYLTLTPSITTAAVQLSADGTDSTVGLNLLTKGAAAINLGIGGTAVGWNISSTGVLKNAANTSGQARIEIGVSTATLPVYAFIGSTTTGLGLGASTSPSLIGNAKEILRANNVASSVNHIDITNSATGNPVIIGSDGTDTNIGIRFTPKGSGSVTIIPSTGILVNSNGVVQNAAGTTGTYNLSQAAATATLPIYSFIGDTVTGLGRAAASTGSLIANSIEVIRFETIASGVNYLDVTPSATGGQVKLAPAGTDTNISLNLVGKGSGGVTIGVAGTDTPIVAIRKYTASFNPASVAAASTAEQTFTVTGLVAATDTILSVSKPTATAGFGIAGWRISADNTLAVQLVNPQTVGASDPGSETWTIVAMRN